MNEKTITVPGRVIYALPYLVFGLMHLANAEMLKGIVPSYIPGGVFWVYATGVYMVVASISIIAGKYVKYTATGLALMLLVFILTIHLPGVMNPEMAAMSMPSLLKDTSMMGAALMLVGMYWNANGEKKTESLLKKVKN